VIKSTSQFIKRPPEETNVDTDERLVETENPWMRVPEAAAYFRIPRSRMYELIQSGQLPAVRIGERSIRVNREEVERFLIENRRIYPGAV
jgi:excisionase family DNA binding protein